MFANPGMKRVRCAVCLQCLLCFLRITSVLGTDILDEVLEVSALLDTNVTLQCAITAEDDIDFVLWKKIFNDDHDKVLIHNNHTTDVDRYRVPVEYPHALTIIGVQLEDEALYQCEINNIGARTVLKVLVPASNLTVTVEGNGAEGGPFNLTCHAQHARPPACLSWFWGTSDITAYAGSYTSAVEADGFGDSSSVLHVPREWENGQVVFRCVASVGDPSADETTFVFLPLTGGAEYMRAVPVVSLLLLCLVRLTWSV